MSEANPLIYKGYNVIINGECNESNVSTEKLHEKFENIGLYNVMESRLNTKDLPRTFVRGKSSIDHIFVTQHLLDNVHRAGFVPFDEGFTSDHRRLFFDIHETILFPANNLNIVHHEFRKLKSNDPKRVSRYLKQLEEDWGKHKIMQK